MFLKLVGWRWYSPNEKKAIAGEVLEEKERDFFFLFFFSLKEISKEKTMVLVSVVVLLVCSPVAWRREIGQFSGYHQGTYEL